MKISNLNMEKLNILIEVGFVKKLILLLLFIPLVSFGQDNNTKINIKSVLTEDTTETGLKYIGNGVYQYAVKGGSVGSTKLMEKRAMRGIEESSEFKAMKKEREIAHIDSVLNWDLDSIPVTKE